MHQLRFLLLFLTLPTLTFAQQRIVLKKSDFANVDNKTNITYVKNPIFVHDNAVLTCDSANYYKDRNFFEAFRNVHINQGDTVNAYSDFLTYDGNTKKAHLSSKVRLMDRTSILTTNILDYDLGLKLGTYVDGGKLEANKNTSDAVTVVSKRGYYFAETKDAYFKFNVVATTPQVVIKSDTLRYNTQTKWTYFYGPTNIKGKDDNLYTEDGAYNTQSENASFGRKNLYTQGSKSLKGDSLYYYGKRGYGRAVKNIVFRDTTDNMNLYGQLGEYYKADERVIVTRQAWFALGTKDSVMVKDKKVPDTMFLGADTLESQKVMQGKLKLLNKPVIKKNNELGEDDAEQKKLKEKEKAEARKAMNQAATPTPVPTDNKKKLSKKQQKLADQAAENAKKNQPPKPAIDSAQVLLKAKLQRDSLVKDSLIKDSLKTDSIKRIQVRATGSVGKPDSSKLTKGKAAKPSTVGKTQAVLPTKKDSVAILNPADTVRARVIKAYHNVRVFKSNMQAKADSLFYTAADSVLRWYKNPILWSSGSQQTADTIHVFFKNNKLHSFQVFQNGFIVNVEETDSSKFNQVKGKLITGFFNQEGNLRDMIVDGNAESMYYNKNAKGEYDNLSQTVSSRIMFKFVNKELSDIVTVNGNDGAVYPIDSLPKETTLTGFIWKPELRPTGKADIIRGKPLTKDVKKTTVKPSVPKPNTNTKSNTPQKNVPVSNKPKSLVPVPVEKKKPDTLKSKPIGGSPG